METTTKRCRLKKAVAKFSKYKGRLIIILQILIFDVLYYLVTKTSLHILLFSVYSPSYNYVTILAS